MNDDFKKKPDLKWVEEVSRLMDAKFTFPGTKFKFGLDPLIGLIPGLGDISSFAISGILIFTMAKYGVSRKILILMSLNIIADAILGSIPLLGNIFDFFYKANTRNINLLRKHYVEGKYHGSGTGILVAIGLVLLLAFALLIFGTYKLFQYLIGLL
jgi:hypothetical protein